MSVLERLVSVDSGARARGRRAGAALRQRRRGASRGLGADGAAGAGQGARGALSLYGRLTDVNEHKLGAHGSALDVVLAAVREFPSELPLWERAGALARLLRPPHGSGGDAARGAARQARRDARVRAVRARGAPARGQAGRSDRRHAVPRSACSLSPSNEVAFQRLKDILTAAERWSELEALYDRAARVTDDLDRRVDMLVEVALICEEITEDAPKATSYYERILEIDPVHDAAIRALDRLYLKQGRSKELAALLERRLETAVGDEAFELKLRLAKLQLELLQPDKAIGHVEDVLRERIGDYEARELAERMLAIGELRPRAARALETVLRIARRSARSWCACWPSGSKSLTASEVGRRAARPACGASPCCATTACTTTRARSDALAELVPMDPLDPEARGRLLEIGRRVSAHERVADVLVKAADKADTSAVKGEILTAVARIYEDLLADPTRAEGIYRRILKLDETDAELVLPAAKALERIYVAAGESTKLAEMLRLQVQHEQDGGTRRELFGRLGTLSQSVLNDEAGAIAAWKSRVDESPDDSEALAALDRLYESAGRFRDLVSVLQRRREASSDAELRRSLMTREAETLWKKLDSVPGGDRRVPRAGRRVRAEPRLAQRARSACSALAKRWEELSETYERHLDLCDSDDERLEILAKLGDIKREQLADAAGAIEVYRRAPRPAHDARRRAGRALGKLLESSDNATRREAALILKPIFESEGDHERLLTTLLIEVDTTRRPDREAERPGGGHEGRRGTAQRRPARLRAGRARRALRGRSLRPGAVVHAHGAAGQRHVAPGRVHQAAVRRRAGDLRRRRAADRHAQDRRLWPGTSWPIAIWRAPTTRRRSSCGPRTSRP